MTSKTLFSALGPVDWDDMLSPSINLPDFVNEKLYHGRAIAASVPGSRPISYTSRAPSCASSAPDTHIAALPEHPRLSSHVLLYSERVRNEWKPVKVGKENVLGVQVFRMSADDGKGTWFGRTSVHRELPFERWKSAFLGEFGEAVKNGTVVRGMSASEILEHRKTGLSQMTVYRLNAQFPGPTAPRDFVSMVLSAESREPTTPVSSAASQTSPTCPLREFIVVSKPCTHPHGRPVNGTIRGTYESVELIREVLVNDDDFREGVAVEWVMVTRSDPGGSVPRFVVERGTPGGICEDAAKFFKWMRTTDLSEYDKIIYESENEECEKAEYEEECGRRECEEDEAMADQQDYPQDEAVAPLVSLHHNGKHAQSTAPPSPNKRRRSIDTNRHSIASIDNAIGGTTAGTGAISENDTDGLSFVSALSEICPSPPPSMQSPHVLSARPTPSVSIPSSPPSRLSDASKSTQVSPHPRHLKPTQAADPPGPGHLQRRSHYTYPITHTDSSVEPPRLSADWMSSTEEIAACLATRHEQRQRHRARTGMAGYEERGIHAANHHHGHGRHHSHESRHGHGVDSTSNILLHKEHRSLTDKLLGRHPPNTYTREEERQLKNFAKAQRLAEKHEQREAKLLEKEEKSVHRREVKERKANMKKERRRKDSTATASTGRDEPNYNTVPGEATDSKQEVPRSADVSRKAEMDVLKEQLVLLQDQNALLAGRLSQMGLEGDEICNVATVNRAARNARH